MSRPSSFFADLRVTARFAWALASPSPATWTHFRDTSGREVIAIFEPVNAS